MPIFTLVTNLPPNKISSTVLQKAAEQVANLFGVKNELVLVSVKAGVRMSWGTQPGTFALGTIQDTNPIKAEDTKALAPAIFEFCEKQLSIPQNRKIPGQSRITDKEDPINYEVITKEKEKMKGISNSESTPSFFVFC